MTNYLFAYGTLMLQFDTVITRFLRTCSSFAGEVRAPGRLYDLGSYPGFIYDEQEKAFVSGQLLELHQTEKILKILDQYEMIDPLSPEKSEYRRERRLVWTSGGWAESWMYLYNGDTSGLHHIRSGRYSEYAAGNEAHLRFMAKARLADGTVAPFLLMDR